MKKKAHYTIKINLKRFFPLHFQIYLDILVILSRGLFINSLVINTDNKKAKN